jgi:hypothetical protein
MRTSPASLPSSDLDRLLATEQRLEKRLAEARAQGQALIAEARTKAEQREGALEAELQQEERRLAETLTSERQQKERAIAEDAERAAAAFERLPEARVTALARELARRCFVEGPA